MFWQWAEVLSADAFSAFEDAGLNDIKVWCCSKSSLFDNLNIQAFFPGSAFQKGIILKRMFFLEDFRLVDPVILLYVASISIIGTITYHSF